MSYTSLGVVRRELSDDELEGRSGGKAVSELSSTVWLAKKLFRTSAFFRLSDTIGIDVAKESDCFVDKRTKFSKLEAFTFPVSCRTCCQNVPLVTCA